MKRVNINRDFNSDEYAMIEQKCNFNKFNGEYEVYKMLKDGASIVEISMKLGLSERTVSRRCLSIRLKIIRAIK